MIKPDHRVRIDCRCGHFGVVITKGWISAAEIRRRGKCNACGERSIKDVTLQSTHGLPALGGYVVGKDGVRRRYETDEELELLFDQHCR